MKTLRLWMLLLGMIISVMLSSCDESTGILEASGTLEAVQVRVPARTMGVALTVPGIEGQSVNAGDNLAILDDTVLILHRDQAMAGREMAAASMQLVLEGARSEDLDLARDALAAAEENFRLAGDEANRLRALTDLGSVSQQQMDRVESAEIQATNARSQAAINLTKLESGARESEIARVRAALDQAEAVLALAEQNLADARIVSPIDGTVLYRMLEPGEWAAPGLTLFVIANLSTLQLTVYIPEPDLAVVRLGQEARVLMDGTENAVTGRISWISPEAEFTPKNVQTKDERVKQVFAVRIDVENPDGILKPGMPADAIFTRFLDD